MSGCFPQGPARTAHRKSLGNGASTTDGHAQLVCKIHSSLELWCSVGDKGYLLAARSVSTPIIEMFRCDSGSVELKCPSALDPPQLAPPAYIHTREIIQSGDEGS